MMQIILKVNNRKIRTVNIVRAQKAPTHLQGETFDYGWYTVDNNTNELRSSGQIRHNYDDGPEVLAQKVLEQVATIDEEPVEESRSLLVNPNWFVNPRLRRK